MKESNHKKTLHFGLLGKSLKHSLSPEIHADLLPQQNLCGTYKLYELPRESLSCVPSMMAQDDLLGMNVTIPYKEQICQFIDVLDSHANAIGAVNTILRKQGMLYGYNTDYIGAVSMFQKAGVCIKKRHIVILGSGGAAKALIYGFHMEQAACITVAARNKISLATLKKHFPYISTCSMDTIPSGDILVNTTPVGMYPKTGVSPVDKYVLGRFKVASDIIYNPLVTEFLQIAQQEGLQIVTGLMMLVDQAIGSEEIWLNKQLDFNMGKHIHDTLANRF